MSRNQRTHKFDSAAQLPPLRHSFPDEPFDIADSEVVDWLISQPEIAQYVFDKARTAKLIEYDAETGTWAGVDR